MGRDVVEMMQARMGDELNPEERYLGAHAMTIKARRAFGLWADGVELDDVLTSYVAEHGSVDELDVADDEVPNAFMAAVTTERLLLFSRSMTGKPRELVDQHDLHGCTLDVADTGARVKSRIFVFGLPSGRVFAGESPINGKALEASDRFVEAWGAATDAFVG